MPCWTRVCARGARHEGGAAASPAPPQLGARRRAGAAAGRRGAAVAGLVAVPARGHRRAQQAGRPVGRALAGDRQPGPRHRLADPRGQPEQHRGGPHRGGHRRSGGRVAGAAGRGTARLGRGARDARQRLQHRLPGAAHGHPPGRAAGPGAAHRHGGNRHLQRPVVRARGKRRRPRCVGRATTCWPRAPRARAPGASRATTCCPTSPPCSSCRRPSSSPWPSWPRRRSATWGWAPSRRSQAGAACSARPRP